ncbi:MAG: hypothetical protein LC808_34985, partial [Actinobacteria bacterium]|nr:hypothetical protein [Actinomycetota bacterium]
VRRGHISKQGSKLVRFVLGEAAQVAKRRPPFAHTYAHIAKRRGKNIATVAEARAPLSGLDQGGRTLDEGCAVRNRVSHRCRPPFASLIGRAVGRQSACL